MLNTHLFGGDTYYPVGGSGDYLGSFLSLDSALEHLNKHHPHGEFSGHKTNSIDWAEILVTDEHGLKSLNLAFALSRPFKGGSRLDMSWQIAAGVVSTSEPDNSRLVKV